MIDDDQSRLRKMERDLYTTDIQPPKKRSLLHEKRLVSSDSWQEAPQVSVDNLQVVQKKVKTTSFFKNIFFASLLFLGVALLFLGISFLRGNNTVSDKNVDIVITTKSFIDGGESLPVEVLISNKNKLDMELATLVLEYPEGGNDSEKESIQRIERDLGTIPAGSSQKESFTIKLYGIQNSQRTITAKLDFRVQGSNAVYDKEEPVMVTIRTSPVTLTLDIPEKITPNQQVPVTVTVVGNGTSSLPNTAVILDFPEGFTFIKSEPSPSFGNKVWYLGDLPPGVNRKIIVYGSFSGGINDFRTLRASIGLQNNGNEQKLDTVYNTLAQLVTLSNAFMDTRIVASGQVGQTIPINGTQRVRISIPFKNTLSVPVTNAQITLRLSGSAYDQSLIEPGSGYFDTVKNQIIWTPQQLQKLKILAPGDEGEVSFSLKPRQSTGAPNPFIDLELSAEGYGSGSEKLSVTALDTKKIVINSDMNLLARTVHFSGDITNTGPIPATVNKETTYTLELSVVNTKNRVTGAVVTTTLPTYVVWKKIISPNTETANDSYNEVTKQLQWNIGEIPTSTGDSPVVKKLLVKVGITPSAQQVGSTAALTGPVTISAVDDFTKQEIGSTKLQLSTRLLNDGNAAGSDGIIVK